jgi:hypothetical protein
MCLHRDRVTITTWLPSVVAGAILLGSVALLQAQTRAAPLPHEQTNDEPVANQVVKEELAPAVQFNVAAPQVAGEPTLKDLIEQTAEEYRPFVLSELHFLRTVCGLTKEQCKLVAREARGLLDETARADGRFKHDKARKGAPGGASLSVPVLSDPCGRLERGLTKIVQDRLTPLQSKHYEEELRKRTAHRKAAGVRGLVARLDGALMLTAGQRDQISANLAANWSEAWGTFALLDDGEQLPRVPDRFITPLLSPAQKKAWEKIEKIDVGPASDRLNLATQVMSIVTSDFAGELGEVNDQKANVPVAVPAP